MRFTVAPICLLLITGVPYAQAQQPPSEVPGRANDHPSLTIGPLKLGMTARIQGQFRTPTDDVGIDQLEADWASRRAGLDGKLWKRVSFQIERDFGDRTNPWRDAYVDVRVVKGWELRSGRFKIPFGREMLTSGANLDFVYRSLAASQLSPSRDSGVMTHGRVLGHRLEYQAGYFVGDGDHARTAHTEGGHDTLSGRIVCTPLAWTGMRVVAPLEVGAAVARSRVDDRLGLRGRTALDDGTFFDRLFVNGTRLRTGVESTWENGPVSFAGEYMEVRDERTGMGFDRADLPPVRSKAWYAAGTWALTGEHKHGGIEPRRPAGAHGFGAVEVAARVERLWFDAATYPGVPLGFPSGAALESNGDRVTTVGVNWYLNHFFKAQANVITESIGDRQRSPAPAAGGRFTSTVIRLQFVL